ncbi:hypothetical protein IPA_08960 [Ignicoccus pacificus DSM 13166]|uniref:Fe-S oxidoreductase n=1 Tax=Ignicoccus pacificus DSM 13166 TaxID=940294 RepID=A0A977KC12_9CREN|nr:hypothetical protein IPA_08960 [Ignicoccus pacificus DSM 13166]
MLDLLYKLAYNSCVGCDWCAEACPWSPRYKPRERLQGMVEAVEACTMCGRCVLKCPLKVPTHKRVYEYRTKKGIVHEELTKIRERSEEIGQSFGIGGSEWAEFAKSKGFKVDERARWLFLPSAFDVLPNARLDLLAELWVLDKLGYDFTLSSKHPEGYGNFIFDMADPDYFKKKALEVIKTAEELDVEGIIIGECGADYKVWPRLHMFIGIKAPFKVLTFPEAVYRRRKEIVVERMIEKRVGYHDPCGLARYNFVTQEPREIIKMITPFYEERGPSERIQMCCGGGAGVSFVNELKRKAVETIGPKKIEQFKGLDLVLTSCSKCKSMLLTYTLLLRGGFNVHRLSYALAWSMGLDVPAP